MAVQEITNTNSLTQEFSKAMRDAGDGPGGTPYMDLREFASRMFDHAQIATGTITATAGGAADGIEVTLGFQPRAVYALNLSGANQYIKTDSMAAAAAYDMTGEANVATAMYLTKIDGTSFGTTANPELGGFSIAAALVTAAHVWHYIALG